MRKGLPNRRLILAGLVAAGLPLPVMAQALDAAELGLVAGSTEDQSAVLQEAVVSAAAAGRPLFIPAGTYFVGNLQIPGDLRLQGVAGASILAASNNGPVGRIAGSANVSLDGLVFAAGAAGPAGADRGLLEIEASADVRLDNCAFRGGGAHGLVVRDAAAAISGCRFDGHGLAAIFALDSRGLLVSGNRIAACGNGGILIWGSENRRDGSILSGNAISGIGWTNGGNGQNGNGINIFRADDVVIADNQIGDCAFSAIRLNATNNVTVTGNLCRNSGEVAIFSEFAFSGSVIADNVVDGAATGISVTNLDSGGHLATVSGNVVRNIAERSGVNPDTRPVGIYVEAETSVTGNTLEAIPGIGILAGNGSFLRNVSITGNVLYATHTGIGVSVAEGAGAVLIAGNVISDPLDHGIAGLEWQRVVSDDLVRDAARYPNVTIAGNAVTRG